MTLPDLGVDILHDGQPVGWVAARWAHACDDNGAPIPGVAPQPFRIEDRRDGVYGVIGTWPGVPIGGVGISETADGDVAVRIPLNVDASNPGDTINIGPLTPRPA